MKQSGLVRAVAFGALVSLSSACAYNQPRNYSYEDPVIVGEVQKSNVQEYFREI